MPARPVIDPADDRPLQPEIAKRRMHRALIFPVWLMCSPALAIPEDVDYGASGLVQFVYECPASPTSCRARCFSNDVTIAERDGVASVNMTAFRTHGRQNAPNFEVHIVPKAGSGVGPATVHLIGRSASSFDSLVLKRLSGFLQSDQPRASRQERSAVARRIDPGRTAGRVATARAYSTREIGGNAKTADHHSDQTGGWHSACHRFDMADLIPVLGVLGSVFAFGYAGGFAHRAAISRRRRLKAFERQGWLAL